MKTKLSNSGILLLVLSPFLYLFREILNGKFWMLDDHVFLRNSYQERAIFGNWNKFVFQIESNNVDLNQHNLRLTPSLNLYYALRTFFFGDDPSKYFILSYSVLLLTIIILCVLLIMTYLDLIRDSKVRLDSSIPPLLLLSAATLFTFPTVIRNYVTLGVSEQIGPLFLFVSYVLILSGRFKLQKGLRAFTSILLPVNTIILIGIKENYAILSIFLLSIGLVYWRESNKSHLISLLSSFLINVLFIVRVKTEIFDVGNDVYGRSTSPATLVSSFLKLMTEKLFLYQLIVVILIFAIARVKKADLNLLILSPVLFVIVDWIFYRGDVRERYATNSIVSVFLITMFLILLLPYLKVKIQPVLFIFSLVILMQNWSDAGSTISRQVLATKNFDAGISRVIDISHLQAKIAFVAQSEWDYESADSVATHLRSRGIVNDIYLFIPKEFSQSTSLAAQMLSWSNEGSSYKFNPKPRDLNKFDVCVFSQTKRQDLTEPFCKRSVVIRWLP
jgi:hypothetical protein